MGKRRHKDFGECDIERFRLMWNDVVYAPGEIVVVAYDENGNETMRKTVKTANKAKQIKLEAYKPAIKADGDELNYITASIIDENGTLCETQDQRLFFKVEGCAELLTTDAGDQRETESFARADKMSLGGKLVACIRSQKDTAGKVKVICSAQELGETELVFECVL